MAKKSALADTKLVDFLTLVLAYLYLQSVLTVAHHASFSIHVLHEGPAYTVGPPAVPALVIGLVLCAYSWKKQQGKFTTLVVICLTVFATASIFWLSGLRTNFYF